MDIIFFIYQYICNVAIKGTFMIIKHENVVTNLYKGGKICFGMFKGENLIYGARSPYNSETTRILMTNFPQKFIEICGYGNMHPQIVPFINEDPMLTCSLGIEGMPIRWLVCEQGSYFELGIVPSENMSLELSVKCAANATNRLFYVRNNYSDGSEYGLWIGANNSVMASWGRGYVMMPLSFNQNGYAILYVDKNKAKINGIEYTLPQGALKTVSRPFVLPALNQNNGIYQDAHVNKIVSLIVNDGNNNLEFLPIIRNGQVVFIEILTGTSAIKHGTPTIEYTLPDGTPWQPTI